jgi:hypothetical protein
LETGIDLERMLGMILAKLSMYFSVERLSIPKASGDGKGLSVSGGKK